MTEETRSPTRRVAVITDTTASIPDELVEFAGDSPGALLRQHGGAHPA